MSDEGIASMWYPEKPESLGQRILRSPLSALSAPMWAGATVRNALYDRRILRAHRVDGAKIISVGNLNVGGAGKTPVTIFLAQKLLERKLPVAVLSRGYGRLTKEPLSFDVSCLEGPTRAGDEPVLIARNAPGARLFVGADRVESAKRAVKEGGAKVILLDDGMQHRRIARDVELLVVDEAAGFGNGALLPRGPLREPLSGLSRATVIWLRAAKTKNDGLPKFTQPLIRARHVPRTVIDPDGATHPAKALAGRKVVALSALARPGAFRRTLEALGAEVVEEFTAPDHHFWEIEEVADAEDAARKQGALLLTTEKDAVKLPPHSDAWVLRIEIEVLSGEQHLEALLKEAA